MKTKQTQAIGIAVLMVVSLALVGLCLAQPTAPVAGQIKKPPQLVTDVQVLSIDTGPCKCVEDLAHSNAMLPTALRVKVANSGAAAVTVVVRAEYTAGVGGNTITASMPNVQLAAGGVQWVTVASSTSIGLMRKIPTGIKGIVAITAPAGIIDTNPANNTLTRTDCGPIVE
jgi:hypothetical protein